MTIPAYPDRRPIALADKPLLDGLFAVLQPQVSELTFACLYLFRQAHDYAVTMVDGSVVVFGRGYGGEPYFLPPLSGERGDVTRRLLDEGHALYGADERFLALCSPNGNRAVVWDLDHRTSLVSFPFDGAGAATMQFSADGRQFAIIDPEGQLGVWTLQPTQLLFRTEAHAAT